MLSHAVADPHKCYLRAMFILILHKYTFSKPFFCDLDKVLPLEVLIFCLQFEGAEMVVKELTFRLLINIELKETLFVIIIIL